MRKENWKKEKKKQTNKPKLCLRTIQKAIESSHKENALVLIAVDMGGKNTQE